MEAALLPSRPPCGLTRQEVLTLASLGVSVVGGLCQNPFRNTDGQFAPCGCPLGEHPSETAPAAPAQATAAPPALLTPPLGKRETSKQLSLKKKLTRRCTTKSDSLKCEICDVAMAVFHTAHLFELSRENEFVSFYEADPDHIPISINNSENGIMICANCHTYFDHKPRLLGITADGTIQLFGLAKRQNYLNLHGKKVPWADKINTKDWPTSALLDVVYKLPPLSKKRKGLNVDESIIDGVDILSSSPPENKRMVVAKKSETAAKAKKSRVAAKTSGASTKRK